MRSVLLPLLILTLVTVVAIAEKQDKPERPSEGFKKERVVKMRSGKYSRIFLSIVYRTKKLDLDDEKKAEISKEAKKYLSSINESEKESRNLQIAFMRELNSEEFDAAKLKTDIKEINKLEQQAAYNFVDGMQAIRKIVGPENFAELTPFTKVDRNALIELRQRGWKSQNQAEPKTKEDTSESN